MDRLIFTAVSGLSDSMNRQRIIASNMANAQTVGFREEMVAATPVTITGGGLDARVMTQSSAAGANMTPGSINQTGQPLDLAMTGDAMIAVQGADGSEAYTRRGDLSVAPGGVLQNGDGRPVIGGSGPITVPPGAAISIAPDGSVLAASPDNPGQPPQVVDRIKLASPAGTAISKGLDGLFRVGGGGVLPTDDAAKVQSGALEASNVDASEVLVQMLSAQRLFEIRTKLVSTAKDIDESGTSLLRLGNS